MTVAALFIDPKGPYRRLLGAAQCWDETRDARLYEGPHPVVAHPPCGPWSRLSHFCKHQDASCGPRAVEQVRTFGGVLEHPANSRLWRHCALPLPGAGVDEFGGRTFEVNQCDWGHPTRKRTWLYCVRTSELPAAPFPGREPTHSVCNGRGQRLKNGTVRQRATALQARLTPPHVRGTSGFAGSLVRGRS
jgi:hypothetical protein